MEISYPCDKSVIETILPHRDPFLWLTRVLSCEPGKRVTAELYIDPDLPLFKGHFPEYPIFPGVLIMEALAQASCFCILTEPEYAGSLGFFAGIDKAKFRNQIRPGDTVTLESEILKSSHRLCVAEVKASIGDKVCATATQKYVLAPKEN